MPESNTPVKQDAPVELVFDIAKPSEQIKFLGLLNRISESGNELTGLFTWTCQACGKTSRDAVILRPQQAFHAKWSCHHCSQTTIVRFLARASTEWIVQHMTVVAGQTVPSDRGRTPTVTARRKQSPRRGGQMVFAWIAVPALVGIIVIGLLDVQRVRHSLASVTPADNTQQQQAAPIAPFVGSWVSEKKDHVVHFGPVDPISGTGTYTVVWRGGGEVETAGFRVVRGEAEGDQFVVVEPNGQPGEQTTDADPTSTRPGVTFYVPTDGRTVIRVDIRQGKSVTSVYHNAAAAPIP